MRLTRNESDQTHPAGVFLVASPYARGSRFQRSIILLMSQSEENARGLVLDAPLRASLRELKESGADNTAKGLRQVAEQRQIPLHVLNWRSERLAKEIEGGLWLVTPVEDRDLVDNGDLWVTLIRRIGRSVLTEAGVKSFPEKPQLN